MVEKVVNVKEGFENFIANWNNFFNACGDIYKFFNRCFNEQGYFINLLKDIAPDIVLPLLLALVILRVLGFDTANKYIALTLVIAIFISIL